MYYTCYGSATLATVSLNTLPVFKIRAYLKHPLESGSVWQLTGNFVQEVIKVVGDGSDGRVDGGVGGTEGGGEDGDRLSGPRRDRW